MSAGQGLSWLRPLREGVEGRLGRVKHALFDFDGTLSVLRQGWEPVMEAVMLAAIWPGAEPPASLVEEVRSLIDATTGQLTILQMTWLAEAVQRYGREPQPLSPAAYKARYLQALMVSVSQRLERLESGEIPAEGYLLAGAHELLAGLAARGVKMYLASGSDHPDVVREAGALGLAGFLGGEIYGALDASEANAKERIIQRILDEHRLSGDELAVIGDGPVEIIEARKRGAIAIGVASDEVARSGWNAVKVERLRKAGADLLVADFAQASQFVEMLTGKGDSAPPFREG